MSAKKPFSRVRPVGRPRGEPTLLVPIKMTPHQRQRFRMLCVEHNRTYAQMIIAMMDEREERITRAKRAQVHPFHQPKPVSSYPSGG